MFGLSNAALSLVIFAVCIVLFVSEKLPVATSAILGCVLMVITGAASFSDVFGQFSSSSVILVMGVMVVGRAMFETGLAQVIGSAILRFSGNSERRLLVVSTLLCSLISAFMSNVATLAMFISILTNLSGRKQKVDLRNLMLPVAMGSVVGGVCTLIGSAPQITAQGLLEEAVGVGFGFFDYAKVGVVLIAALLAYVYFIGYPVGKRIWGNRSLSEEELGQQRDLAAEKEADRRQMAIMSVIFVTMGVMFFLELFPIALVSTLAALACIATGCITQKQAIAGISWSSVGKLAGCLGIMQAVNKSGGGDLIANLFFKAVGYEIAPYLLFLLMCSLTLLLSEFLTNSTALLIVLPMAIDVAPMMGLNIYAYAMGITLASSVALATPLSCTPLTMVMGHGYRFSDYAKYSLPFDLIALAVILLAVPMIYPLMA